MKFENFLKRFLCAVLVIALLAGNILPGHALAIEDGQIKFTRVDNSEVSATTSMSSNYYRCRIKDSGGNTIYTNAARLYVLGVTKQPTNQKVEAGDTVNLTVSATGASKTYQWQYSKDGKTWSNCVSSSAKSAAFSFTAKTSHNGNYYRCRITDSAGNVVYSNSAKLTVK